MLGRVGLVRRARRCGTSTVNAVDLNQREQDDREGQPMNATTITITRQVPVDAERAFRAWIDPGELAQWWWPQWPETTYEVDAWEGGDVRIDAPNVQLGVTGTFTDYDPPRRFVMTWVWVSDGTAAQARGEAVVDTVEVTFDAVDGGTEVTVRHTSTEHEEDGGAEQGWNDVLGRLPGHLAD